MCSITNHTLGKMAASPHTQNQPLLDASDGNPDTAGQFASDKGDYYGVMAHGLPYDVTKNEVAEFFSDCCIKNGKDGIHILIGPDGRLQGDAVIELEGQEDLDKAKQLHNQMMGRRYIEISSVSRAVADHALSNQPGGGGSDYVIRLRGLPYSATARDILNLLHDCKVTDGDKGIRFSFAPNGRPSGEAFVELASEEDVSKALGHDNEHMGKRYVEIFRATKGQLEWEGRMAEKVGGGTGGVVRLRGLPYRCTEEDIRQFFQEMSLPAGGVTLQVDPDGRETGEAYVEFIKPEEAEKALYKDRQMIGHRYIEVFRSTHAEIRPVASKESRWARGTPYSRPGQPWGNRGGSHGGYGGYGGYSAKFGSGFERGGRGRGYGRGGAMPPAGGGFNSFGDGGGSYSQYPQGGYDYTPQPQGYGQYNAASNSYGGAGHGGDTGTMVAYPPIRSTQPGGRGGGEDYEKARHCVKMRGLPYSAKEKEISDFFLPHVPARVEIEYNQHGRPSGSAEVVFNTHEEAEKAMEKNNEHMGHRYIELFLTSRPGMGGEPVREGSDVAGRGGARGGEGGGGNVARYPAQTSWPDTTRGSQGVYGTSSQQQPQQYVQQQTYTSYQQPQQPVQSQPIAGGTTQWPQQGGYQHSGGYQQQPQQQQQPSSYQQQSSYQPQQQQQQHSAYQQTGQDGYAQHSQTQAQTQWY